MNSQSLISEVRENHLALKYQFIMIELELAETFCGIAMATNNPRTANRNIVNAQRAYAAAGQSSQGFEFTDQMADEIEARACQVSSLISHLSPPSTREVTSEGRRPA